MPSEVAPRCGLHICAAVTASGQFDGYAPTSCEPCESRHSCPRETTSRNADRTMATSSHAKNVKPTEIWSATACRRSSRGTPTDDASVAHEATPFALAAVSPRIRASTTRWSFGLSAPSDCERSPTPTQRMSSPGTAAISSMFPNPCASSTTTATTVSSFALRQTLLHPSTSNPDARIRCHRSVAGWCVLCSRHDRRGLRRGPDVWNADADRAEVKDAADRRRVMRRDADQCRDSDGICGANRREGIRDIYPEGVLEVEHHEVGASERREFERGWIGADDHQTEFRRCAGEDLAAESMVRGDRQRFLLRG